MTSLPAAISRPVKLKGSPQPRLAPPVPARSQVVAFKAQAKDIGIDLIPWQEVAARYLTALGRGETWAYSEVAIVVGRQNGKTTLLEPLILSRLRAGHHIIHTAQNRDLPREVFLAVADVMLDTYPEDLKGKPRFANGQESIRTKNGGIYRIVAPTRGGARGGANDLVIADELREMVDWSLVDAAKPTTITRPKGQFVYLSNAGTEESIVLNTLRKRALAGDPSLAYLEWSAAPERKPEDIEGWLEANPSIGHLPSLLPNLEKTYQSAVLGETIASFETEHLCRWVVTMQPPLVALDIWGRSETETGEPRRPIMGVSLDPSGMRASAVIAWQEEGGIALRVIADVTGDPIDLDRFGPDLKSLAAELHVSRVVYSPYDDHLARYFFPRPGAAKSIRDPLRMDALAYANASGTFVRLLEGGQIRWSDAAAIGDDLPWATRHTVGPGAWVAVKRKEDHPITAVRAAIQAVGIASAPQPQAPRVM